MKTATRGNAGEGAVLGALVQSGHDVLIPFGDGHSFDLVVHLRGFFIRVQVKTGWIQRGCVLFNPYATDHGKGPVPYAGRADIFGVFCPETRKIYLVPIDAVAAFSGRLRIEPTRNNQSRGIRYAEQFEIESWTPERLLKVLEPSASAQLKLEAA